MLVTNDGYNKEVSYMVNNSKNYRSLIKDIGSILEEGRKQAFRVVNNILTKTYWEIGSQIVEFEQIGNETGGGEQQILTMRAVMFDSKLLMLDELFIGLGF